MSVLKKTMSITRFKIASYPEGMTAKDIELLENIKNNQFVDIETGEEISWGWTKLLDPYCPMFDDMSFITGNYVTMGLRIDKKSVPAATIKKELYFAYKKEMEEKQIPKLARAQKILIKEAVVKNLLTKAPVVPVTYDVIWCIEEEVVYLFTTNKLAKEMLEEMMSSTFDIALEMVFPFTMGLNTIDEKVLSEIQPTSFA